MRILLANKFYYRRGGDCVYTLSIEQLLRSKGHEVAIFSMRHPKNAPCAQDRYFVDYIDFAELNRRKTLRGIGQVLSRSIYSLHARRQIRKLITDFKPDVAHLQNIHSYLTPSIVDELSRARIPIVWTMHDYKLICPEDSFLSNGRICEECKGGRFYRCTINRCKKNSCAASLMASAEAYVHQFLRLPQKVFRFVSPSRFLRDKFIEFGWDANQIRFIRNFLPDLPTAHTRGKGYGLYLGTLLPTKGVRTLLDALSVIPDMPFHILGDGSERAGLEKTAHELGLRKVTFRGFLTGDELEDEMAGADFGVVPSEWYENCPYSVMELMARGKPIIASRIGGLPELVKADKTGLLFEPHDATTLADHMSRLYAEPDLRSALGIDARRCAEREFDAHTHYTQIIDLYEAALESTRGKR